MSVQNRLLFTFDTQYTINYIYDTRDLSSPFARRKYHPRNARALTYIHLFN